MSTDLIGLVFEKIKVPHQMKAGLVLSFLMFKAFDIEGRVKRAMQPKTPA